LINTRDEKFMAFPHGMVVTAPPGMDVDVDNDGGDIEIDIEPRGRKVLGIF